jgi:ribosomal protein L14E/L6E/L27E
MVTGQIVFTKCGRDKGKAFIVISIHEDYLYLVDGKVRTLCKPKKKKAKHVQPTNYIAELKTDGRALQDADIRKHLKTFAK